ncbi:hypothetical protein [Nakamurella endophytica]|uniref:Uncharacterized protein n=1 Tax=Nakamurella endophytica TaxID=1748367 RepID=A0A917WFI8_9ACTN|nr:hypothetical protein [Nakamurella endophytica]GGM02704.1 hypothetical protein GCM10011594_23510 [Nakamurella endophytica]
MDSTADDARTAATGTPDGLPDDLRPEGTGDSMPAEAAVRPEQPEAPAEGSGALPPVEDPE